jgi:undecaprenyl diphosphate synthase|tara:strand:+ start:7015 stop:7743 length:729 start_codon:yes stop_codon:yes gene_type:complete
MANTKQIISVNAAENVAIIMDGNGRWAFSNSLNVSKGHAKGVEIARNIVEESVKQKLSSLTLYAFSSENWSRPKAEVEAIKRLIILAIEEQVPDLIKQKVRLKFFGRIDDFGSKIINKINDAEKATNLNQPSLSLNIALGYGGRQDIVDVTKNITRKVLSKEINVDDIDENMINKFSSAPIDQVDLLIRTGGDKRISNFLLYQIAYTEISFCDKFWPDFSKKDFLDCLENFKKVNRRFGRRI